MTTKLGVTLCQSSGVQFFPKKKKICTLIPIIMFIFRRLRVSHVRQIPCLFTNGGAREIWQFRHFCSNLTLSSKHWCSEEIVQLMSAMPNLLNSNSPGQLFALATIARKGDLLAVLSVSQFTGLNTKKSREAHHERNYCIAISCFSTLGTRRSHPRRQSVSRTRPCSDPSRLLLVQPKEGLHNGSFGSKKGCIYSGGLGRGL